MDPSQTVVLYFWTGVARVGQLVSAREGKYLVFHPHYDEPVETKAIYPLFPGYEGYVGEPWEDLIKSQEVS